MRLYLAGPMTGKEKYNLPKFHSVAEKLRKKGYEIVNPAEHGNWLDVFMHNDYDNAPNNMARDIGNMVEVIISRCDGVVLLPGWEDSKGAKIEAFTAITFGLKPHIYDEDYEEPFFTSKYQIMKAITKTTVGV